MTLIQPTNDIIDENTPRKMYFALIAFTGKNEGSVSVPAVSVDHARELIQEWFKGHPDLEIIDIADQATLAQEQAEIDAEQVSNRVLN